VIDLHCHILPGVDDGARDLADSLAMARHAAADGVRVVCATPHVRHDHATPIRELAERVAALNAEIARAGIDLEVRTGGEVAEEALDRLDDDELRAVSLGGGGGWVLLEPAKGPIGDRFLAAVRELRARGLRTVIAHPERRPASDLGERLAEATAAGALTQLTAAVLRYPGAGTVLRSFTARGLIHVLASDSHSSRSGRALDPRPARAAFGRLPGVALT